MDYVLEYLISKHPSMENMYRFDILFQSVNIPYEQNIFSYKGMNVGNASCIEISGSQIWLAGDKKSHGGCWFKSNPDKVVLINEVLSAFKKKCCIPKPSKKHRLTTIFQ